MTLSSHKLGGPQGAGALICRAGVDPPVLLTGGGQEKRRRAGTENIPAIAGFGSAAAHAAETVHEFQALKKLQDKLENGLRVLAEDVVIFGAGAERVANTTCFSVPGTQAETLLIALDLENIAVSSGSACSSGKVKKSHVLKAMGFDDQAIAGALRVSTGWGSSEADIDRFLEAFTKILNRIRK